MPRFARTGLNTRPIHRRALNCPHEAWNSAVSCGLLGPVAPRRSRKTCAPVLAAMFLAATLIGVSPAHAAPTLPSGFVEEVVANGLSTPSTMAFLPDGRILVAEKAGVVKVIKNGIVLAQPFIDLSASVNNYWDRGVTGIVPDPNFTTNGYVYLFY